MQFLVIYNLINMHQMALALVITSSLKDKGQYQFIHIGLDLKDQQGNSYSLSGLTKVQIAPRALHILTNF